MSSRCGRGGEAFRTGVSTEDVIRELVARGGLEGNDGRLGVVVCWLTTCSIEGATIEEDTLRLCIEVVGEGGGDGDPVVRCRSCPIRGDLPAIIFFDIILGGEEGGLVVRGDGEEDRIATVGDVARRSVEGGDIARAT